jgi:hypothetical protein
LKLIETLPLSKKKDKKGLLMSFRTLIKKLKNVSIILKMKTPSGIMGFDEFKLLLHTVTTGAEETAVKE